MMCFNGCLAKGEILQWRHNERDCVSNHLPHDCSLNRLFRHRSQKTSKLRATGLCEGNSLVNGEFPAQMARNAENVSIWWRHHLLIDFLACRQTYSGRRRPWTNGTACVGCDGTCSADEPVCGKAYVKYNWILSSINIWITAIDANSHVTQYMC